EDVGNHVVLHAAHVRHVVLQKGKQKGENDHRCIARYRPATYFAARMTRRILLAALLAAACRESAQLPLAATTTGSDPALRHYDIRFEQLPPPFATRSAGNPPVVVGS